MNIYTVGRKKFAKLAFRDRQSGRSDSVSPPGSQRSSRYETPVQGARDSPSQVRRRPQLPSNLFNRGSYDEHRHSIVGYPSSGPTTPDVTNPAYAEGSPTNRPRLPYPGYHYDMISHDRQNK